MKSYVFNNKRKSIAQIIKKWQENENVEIIDNINDKVVLGNKKIIVNINEKRTSILLLDENINLHCMRKYYTEK